MSMFMQDNTKLASAVMAVIFASILTIGLFLFMFPAPVAPLGDSYDPDTGVTVDDQSGIGMTWWAVDEDGNEFEIAPSSIFPSSVWIGGVPLSNVYASVKTSYQVSGFQEGTQLTISAEVSLGDWFAEDPLNDYYAMQMGTTVDPVYITDSVSSTVVFTTTDHAKTDFIIGRMYFAPEEGQSHLFPSEWGSTIEEIVIYLFERIHGDDSVADKTLSVIMDAQVTITGQVETVSGPVPRSIQSDRSLNYRLKIELSAGAVTGTVDVEIGSFSLDGAGGYGDIPVILMLIGGVGFAASLAVLIMPKDTLPFL